MRNPQETNRQPENRQGTRSNRAMKRSYYCNVDGGSTCLRATNKHWAKARAVIDNNKKGQRGRIIKACVRELLDSLFSEPTYY